MTDRELMAEAAILYYHKKMTQQEIANVLYLSRQTVSKLLTEALNNNIVEITVHHPKKDCEKLAEKIQNTFDVPKAVIIGTGSRNDSVRTMLTVKAAAEYIAPFFAEGNQKIAVSWGRTIQALVAELPSMDTKGNLVFPLFGATEHENSFFSSNEMARSIADRIGASVKYAWFPYLPDNEEDGNLIRQTAYYQQMCKLWNEIDIAVVGIGNLEIGDFFKYTFGHVQEHREAIGDIATHFFTREGKILNLYENTLCASAENIRNAKNTIAVACGSSKVESIASALCTNLVDVLITDEHTAKELIALHSGSNSKKKYSS